MNKYNILIIFSFCLFFAFEKVNAQTNSGNGSLVNSQVTNSQEQPALNPDNAVSKISEGHKQVSPAILSNMDKKPENATRPVWVSSPDAAVNPKKRASAGGGK